MTMERQGCCGKLCLGEIVCMECCANEAFFHAGKVTGKAGELDKSKVFGRAKVPIPFAGGFTPVIQVMDRDATSDHHFASVKGPMCFGGCSELCCSVPFTVKKVNKDGSISVNVGDVATITKMKPKSFADAMRELLTDSDLYELEIHDLSLSAQQRASLVGTLLLCDYMFFERDIDACSYNVFTKELKISLCNCFCLGKIIPCQCTCGGDDKERDS